LSTDNPITRRFLDLDEVEHPNDSRELNLDKFLAAATEELVFPPSGLVDFKGSEGDSNVVVMNDCLKGSILSLKDETADPSHFALGKSLLLTADGVFLEERDLTHIHIEIYFNRILIFKDDLEKKEHVTKDSSFSYSYTFDVQAYLPRCNLEIYVSLIGGEEKLACMEASFVDSSKN